MRRIREAQGFFKHADEDAPDKVLKFYPEATSFHLIEAAHLAFALTGRMPPESRGLIAWSIVAYPQVFKLDDTPYLRKVAEEFSKILKPDDFELILYAIDQSSPQATASNAD